MREGQRMCAGGRGCGGRGSKKKCVSEFSSLTNSYFQALEPLLQVPPSYTIELHKDGEGHKHFPLTRGEAMCALDSAYLDLGWTQRPPLILVSYGTHIEKNEASHQKSKSTLPKQTHHVSCQPPSPMYPALGSYPSFFSLSRHLFFNAFSTPPHFVFFLCVSITCCLSRACVCPHQKYPVICITTSLFMCHSTNPQHQNTFIR